MTEKHDDFQRTHILVNGRVQNVGFRAFVQQIGNRLGITGWVRNVNGNQVEIVAEGLGTQLDIFAIAVKKGLPGSRVDLMSEDRDCATGEFMGFSVRSSK